MRRLPVYFLIDVSESMAGESISAVEKGIRFINAELGANPYALETVFISILVFAGKAEVLVPFSEIGSIKIPVLSVGRGTALGAGLKLLMQKISMETKKPAEKEKGDFKPLVFIVADGKATDNPLNAIKKWRLDYLNYCSIAVITLGHDAEINLLTQLGGKVFTLANTSQESIIHMFKWLCSIILEHIKKLNKTGFDEIFSMQCNKDMKEGDASKISKDNSLILMGRCAKKTSGYLLRYLPNPEAQGADPTQGTPAYNLEGVYAINLADYDRLSGTENQKMWINTALLGFIPSCPCCGAYSTMLQCEKCGGIFCGAADTMAKCPWCSHEMMPDNYIDMVLQGCAN